MKQPTRRAIVDIGSNSIRLVVFGGAPRAPVPLFNEKVMAGLGRGVVESGQLSREAMDLALRSLGRFAALLKAMGPSETMVVATAAVREASNGTAFLESVRSLGLPVMVLSGEDEALSSAYGVLSTHPQADGVVVDIGGGSLELARVTGGQVMDRVSLPLGAMRIAAIRAGGTGRLRKRLKELLTDQTWTAGLPGQRLYLVGGAWRALARVHMHLTSYPLPVLDNYTFASADSRMLKTEIRALGMAQITRIPGVKAARALQLDDAAALLAALAFALETGDITVSASGLREGLLFRKLSKADQELDPLIEGLRHAVGGQLQQLGQDEALLHWSDSAFPDEQPEDRRLRHAACLIAGTGWASTPQFRALAGEEMALHGAWSGVDHADRAVIAYAVHVALGGDPENPPAILALLSSTARLARARAWGHALRLAQRLTGGASQALATMPLVLQGDDRLDLRIPKDSAALIDAGVERRLAQLGQALGRNARIEF